MIIESRDLGQSFSLETFPSKVILPCVCVSHRLLAFSPISKSLVVGVGSENFDIAKPKWCLVKGCQGGSVLPSEAGLLVGSENFIRVLPGFQSIISISDLCERLPVPASVSPHSY